MLTRSPVLASVPLIFDSCTIAPIPFPLGVRTSTPVFPRSVLPPPFFRKYLYLSNSSLLFFLNPFPFFLNPLRSPSRVKCRTKAAIRVNHPQPNRLIRLPARVRLDVPQDLRARNGDPIRPPDHRVRAAVVYVATPALFLYHHTRSPRLMPRPFCTARETLRRPLRGLDERLRTCSTPQSSSGVSSTNAGTTTLASAAPRAPRMSASLARSTHPMALPNPRSLCTTLAKRSPASRRSSQALLDPAQSQVETQAPNPRHMYSWRSLGKHIARGKYDKSDVLSSTTNLAPGTTSRHLRLHEDRVMDRPPPSCAHKPIRVCTRQYNRQLLSLCTWADSFNLGVILLLPLLLANAIVFRKDFRLSEKIHQEAQKILLKIIVLERRTMLGNLDGLVTNILLQIGLDPVLELFLGTGLNAPPSSSSPSSSSSEMMPAPVWFRERRSRRPSTP
ncbi:hypothetical protein MVEN_01734600 [Mycena venus]|uniref:Uncharacterized protein n=1 Tax=Mycena venus TaxID=2733690 RepID=A0A8H6XKR5_9AGAR|nr:hypothetical protein MVEN_01734600 [Mycena venus]